ncbi:Molybdopterin synthase catalytic subunit [Penicillium chermesinum]|uniref:Molybdopterin synthase catalytic subunit n=1 Tax=Penicillium chermesinum TaxID=63820 RepID=A0A9W9NHJ0_9EURO|nr:Molybdopterin synthase catalytic subunit [Penicillium chermesinum]KAJ5219982.1 Molybdopterin synthase catalytic subunit [Penicillium chermesinum]
MTTESSLPAHLDPATYPRTQHDKAQNIHLTLTYDPLDANTYLAQTSSPAAGANVLFPRDHKRYLRGTLCLTIELYVLSAAGLEDVGGDRGRSCQDA